MNLDDNTQESQLKSFITRTACPLCNNELVINWQEDRIPYFGDVMYISADCCNCSFRFADTMILTQKEPMRFEMKVENLNDLNARVIRSTSGTIRIPELGIDVEPGSDSESYITNIEGILKRIHSVVVMATGWVKDETEAYNTGLEIQKKIQSAICGEFPLTIVMEDPLGNSAIISDKVSSRILSSNEAANLQSGMVIFDLDSSDKPESIGNDYK